MHILKHFIQISGRCRNAAIGMILSPLGHRFQGDIMVASNFTSALRQNQIRVTFARSHRAGTHSLLYDIGSVGSWVKFLNNR